jgi:transcription elongation factor greA
LPSTSIGSHAEFQHRQPGKAPAAYGHKINVKSNKNIEHMALTYMTKEGYKKKMEEIAFLESVERPRVSAAIAEARDKGDLSENSEYDAAKEAQGMLEMKIAKLKDLVANARIIDESKLNTEEVNILSRVKIKNTANGMSVEYTIVADSEANMRDKKIGASTPIAKGLLGHKVGDIVEIKVPAGLMKFEIESISI